MTRKQKNRLAKDLESVRDAVKTLLGSDYAGRVKKYVDAIQAEKSNASLLILADVVAINIRRLQPNECYVESLALCAVLEIIESEP